MATIAELFIDLRKNAARFAADLEAAHKDFRAWRETQDKLIVSDEDKSVILDRAERRRIKHGKR